MLLPSGRVAARKRGRLWTPYFKCKQVFISWSPVLHYREAQTPLFAHFYFGVVFPQPHMSLTTAAVCDSNQGHRQFCLHDHWLENLPRSLFSFGKGPLDPKNLQSLQRRDAELRRVGGELTKIHFVQKYPNKGLGWRDGAVAVEIMSGVRFLELALQVLWATPCGC